MFTQLFQDLGLAKNEAKVYQTLLNEGQSPASFISTKSKVHRRNVYDTLQRLIEKGLVFEILQGKENHYQAVDPKKLAEVLQEKQNSLSNALPELTKIYQNNPAHEAVYIYRGVEGWKNYMRDILRKNQDDYVLSAKGVWTEPKLKNFTDQFAKQANKQGIKFKFLFLDEARERSRPIIDLLKPEHRYLPKGFEPKSDIEVFGDQTVIIADDSKGLLRDDLSLTVIVNQNIADSFRQWFNLLWSISKPK